MSTDPRCTDIVELVTEYLDGSMKEDDRQRFERHLAFCTECDIYLDQMRGTIAATGALAEEGIDPGALDRLVDIFRDFRR